MQPLQRLVIAGEALGLAMLLVRHEAKPAKILPNRAGEFLARSFPVGVVEPQDEAATMPTRPQPIVERGPDIADMEAAGGRGGEASDDGHGPRV